LRANHRLLVTSVKAFEVDVARVTVKQSCSMPAARIIDDNDSEKQFAKQRDSSREK
jgi:hypothetical protein